MISNDNTSFATLLDTGNLVLRAGNRILWQSFDHPSDTWLPGMKLGVFRSTTGETQQRFLTSWISPLAPRIGAFTFGVDLNNTKELVAWRRGVVYWRSGMWNGYNFTYFPSAASHLLPGELSFSYFSNKSQSYFTYNENKKSRHFIDIGSSGEIEIIQMGESYRIWYVMGSSNCDSSIPSKEDNHGGCAKKNPEPSTCKEGDTFRQYTNLSMDVSYYIGNGSLGIRDCEDMCIKSCVCKAYASLLPDETGCQFSEGPIYDLGTGINVIYMRNGTVVTGNNGESNNGTSQGGIQSLMFHLNTEAAIVDEDHELRLFTFSSIQIATNFFSDANKIGQGGFGPVYKGQLANGQEIAVKRLSKSSGQGLEEFKNEVILISRLQHRNLVKLLGCCAQGDERILIYEYMPNKSLDSFLFDTRQALLDWKIRVFIIEGIAQGLLYLHKYSRLKIIHRDLKTSNILLDSNMNPKISDFGTARIFGDNESRVNTSKIVGTRGYMSPEYAMDGLFSVKSDVFSFGVMMLEIISGKKNTGFYQPDRALNLVGYAWDLWKEGRGLEIMDHALLETASGNEVMRYIQVGFLCVQESAADRPTISEVVSMLSNDMIAIPTPKQPSFSAIVCLNHTNIIEIPKSCSINDVTISEEEGR